MSETKCKTCGSEYICEINGMSKERDKANAEFIVLACNSYEELLEACKEAIKLIDILPDKYKVATNKGFFEQAINHATGIGPLARVSVKSDKAGQCLACYNKRRAFSVKQS